MAILRREYCTSWWITPPAFDAPHGFCSVLFSSTYSLMRGGLCRKQTYTVTVIHYSTDDRYGGGGASNAGGVSTNRVFIVFLF